MASDYVVGLYEGLVLAESVKVPRGALKFTNTTGQLRLGTGPSSGSSFSFCSWVKITTDTNAYALWLSLQGASTTYWEAGFDTTGTGSIVNDAFTERAVGINFSVGTWYFFGVSQSSGNCKVMIGTEGGTLTKFTSTLANLTLPLSEKLYGGELSVEALAGAMSEARFWNAALTDAEFLTEYYSAVQARTSNAGGYHKLENTTSKLTDSSAASNNLTAPTGTGTWAFEPGPDIAPAPFGAPFENVAMAETIDVVYTPAGGTAYNGNVNETVTVSEALGVVDNAIVGVAETDGLSEATAAAYSAIVAPAETVSVSESLATQSNEASGVSETVTVSEATSATVATAGSVSETVTVSDSTAAVYAATVATSETVTASDSLATQSDGSAALSETVTLSESLAGGSEFTAATSETVSVSESLGSVAATAGSVAETVTASESVGSQAVTTDAVSETVTTSEGGTFTYSGVVSPSESVTVTESVTGIQGGGGGISYSENLSETVSDSESVASVFSASVATAEALYITSAPLPELGTTDLHLVAEDWTPGTNWVSRVGGFTATLAGSLSKQEEGGIERAGVVGFGSGNYFELPANSPHEFSTSSRLTYEFLIRQGAAGGNLLGRYASPFGGGYDLSAFSSGVVAGVYGDDGLSFYAVTVGATALASGSYYLITVVLDGAGDVFETYVNGTVDSSDPGGGSTVTNTSPVAFFIGNSNGNDQPFDGAIVEVLRHRSALNSTVIRSRWDAFNVVGSSRGTSGSTSETITVSDATSNTIGAVPTVAETVNVTESVGLAQVLANILSETVSVVESANAVAALARAVAETVTLSESAASVGAFASVLSETANLSDSTNALYGAVIAVAEADSLSEAITGILNLQLPLLAVAESANQTAVVVTQYLATTAEAAYSIYLHQDGGAEDMVTINTRVRLTATFTSPTGALYDPATLSLVVVNDAGSTTTYTYPTNITKDSTGVYHYDLLCSSSGYWRYKWISAATGEEVTTEGQVRVAPVSF